MKRVKLKNGDYIATDGIYDTNQSKTLKAINADEIKIQVMDISVTITTYGQLVSTGLSTDTYGVLNIVTIPPEDKTSWCFTNFIVAQGKVWKVKVGRGDGLIDGTSAGTLPATVRVFYYEL